MHERLAAGELEAAQAQRLGLAHGRLEKRHRQGSIAAAVGIKLGRQPTVTASQVTTFGQVKVELVQGWYLFGDDAPPGLMETNRKALLLGGLVWRPILILLLPAPQQAQKSLLATAFPFLFFAVSIIGAVGIVPSGTARDLVERYADQVSSHLL